MYTCNCALILDAADSICFPHAKADRKVVHFVPVRDARIGRGATQGGGIEL